ncbi:VAN3-binding protein isoform X2 [Amborella trichopoda]|uniref:VAN3-binding protein isoform X2 n=1 Tax=Amborella trichopoda TaxID=13333 RepID=UPI0009BCFF61|nr:VAN3-binding protein isoform X2 [Amborella trichopoda]|eukprot:XP_020523717.1 VAN3-binding protein isoform X2 [Amborella trichopoda]
MTSYAIVSTETVDPVTLRHSLSRCWSNSAISVFNSMLPFSHQPHNQLQKSIVQNFADHLKTEIPVDDRQMDFNDEDMNRRMPAWSSDELKLNMIPTKEILLHPGESIRRWLKEMKQRKKEEERLRKAEAHAAVSVAGVAAALAAISAENAANQCGHNPRDSAMASAAALVASQCIEIAQSMGAKRDEIAAALASAVSTKSTGDIITLTAVAATSLRGVAALKARPAHKVRGNHGFSVIPYLEVGREDIGFEKRRAILAQGEQLIVHNTNGKCKPRFISIVLNNQAKLVLKIRKNNMLKSLMHATESFISNMHSSLQEDSAEEDDRPYLIVLETTEGIIKLEMNESVSYKIWSMTINYMLLLSTSYSGYELQF